MLFTGFVGFVLGVVLIITGRSVAAREAKRTRGLGSDALKPFLDWFLSVLKTEWPTLTGATSLPGERVAAAGGLLTGVSVVTMVAGVIVATVGSVAS